VSADLTRRGEDAAWARGAAGLALFGLALLLLDALVWHRGYAFGDENFKVGTFQRIIEGAPNWWSLTQGSLHRALTVLCMRLLPGRILALSLPAMAAYALECALLFTLLKRWAGARAAFFGVAAVTLAAFTLVRGRSVLSFSLFPAEWLLLVLLRDACKKPWQQVLWGALLGLFCHDYDGWLLTAAALFVLPFPSRRGFRDLAYEAAGFIAVVLALTGTAGLLDYVRRRQNSSFLNETMPSAGWDGLRQLFTGGNPLPYMAPQGHPVVPWWFWPPLLLGLPWVLRRRPALLAFLGLGLLAPLLGGTLYGVPCHRFIIGWPAACILAGLGMDAGLRRLEGKRWAALLAFGWLTVGAAVELGAWQRSQDASDAGFRSVTRNIEQAALAAKAKALSLGVPLVTELHPDHGAQVRFFSGQSPVPVTTGAACVVAVIPWDYLPAVKRRLDNLQAFQDSPGQPAAFAGVYHGADAARLAAVELKVRPVLKQYADISFSEFFALQHWLEDNKDSSAWARNIIWDKLLCDAVGFAAVPRPWFERVWMERMVTARVYYHASRSLQGPEPEEALRLLRAARAVDPYNGSPWQGEELILRRLGRKAEADKLLEKREPYVKQGLWVVF
jgi:hypothetical protein